MTSLTSHRPLARQPQAWQLMGLALLAMIVFTGVAYAAGSTGTALQATYNMVNDMVGGYGKQLLTVLAFTFALIGYLASNATSVVLKFVGFSIFASVGLAAATGIIGALV